MNTLTPEDKAYHAYMDRWEAGLRAIEAEADEAPQTPSSTCSECFGTGRAVGYGDHDELIWIDCDCPEWADNANLVTGAA